MGILKKYGIALPSAVAAPVTAIPLNEPVVPPTDAGATSALSPQDGVPAPVVPDAKLVPEPEAPPFDESSLDDLEKK